MKDITIFGAPMEWGAKTLGCAMAPASLRTAGIVSKLQDLGRNYVIDGGDIANFNQKNDKDYEPFSLTAKQGEKDLIKEKDYWIKAIKDRTFAVADSGSIPLIMGGDHAISFGTVPAMAEYANKNDRELFVLWIDAHSDFNTPKTSFSGNFHGMPVAYFCGLSGFDAGTTVKQKNPVKLDNVCIFGARSIDNSEQKQLAQHNVLVHDMRKIDEIGILNLISKFLAKVRERNGYLHVSFDVDFLDPDIAPAVGTTVPGGATFREAHLVMELIYDSGLLSSLEVVELNPFLDERGKTSRLMVDLATSAFGKRVFDYPTRTI